MMYEKDIPQLFFEDPNKTVQSVFFKDMFLLDILVISKHQNAITTLRCVECQYSRSQNMFNFSVSFCEENT